MIKWDPKDPDDVDSFGIDWSSRLVNETIASSTWLAFDPDDGNLTKNSDNFTTTATTIWLSGGVDGETYKLTNRIVTTAGRRMDQTVRLKVSTQ